MKFMLRTIQILLLFIAFTHAVSSQSMQVFEKFDDFEKKVLKNNDTTYVINFWATWCKPCVKELPYFESFKQSIGDKKIKVLLVSLDFKNQIKSHLEPFIKKNQYTSEVILLSDNKYNTWLEKVDAEWSGSIPATLLLSGKKKLFAEREFESAEDLNKFVHSFIHSL